MFNWIIKKIKNRKRRIEYMKSHIYKPGDKVTFGNEERVRLPKIIRGQSVILCTVIESWISGDPDLDQLRIKIHKVNTIITVPPRCVLPVDVTKENGIVKLKRPWEDEI